MFGLIAPLIGAGVSLVGGLLGQRSANKQANAQNQLQQQQIDMAKARIDDYNNRYGPLEQMLIDRAKKGAAPDLGGVTARANADVNQQFDNTLASHQRNLGRMGFSQHLKLAGSDESALLARAKALAGNITTARENERRQAESNNLKMLGDVTQIGVNKMNNAQSSLDTAMNNMANSYGNRAAASANSAAGLLQGAGAIGGTLLQDYLAQRTNPMEYAYRNQKIPEPVYNPNWNQSAPTPVIMDTINNNPYLASSA